MGEVEDNLNLPRETFFSPGLPTGCGVSASSSSRFHGHPYAGGVGTGLPALIAAGSGALIGAAIGRAFHERYARRVREQLSRGGLLLWVNVRDESEEKTALEVLRQHSAHDVHAHKIAA
jgi:hypothetical protein